MVLLLCVCTLGVSCQEKCPLLLAPAGVEITGCYVVVLKKGLTPSIFEMMESKLLNMSKDWRLYGSVRLVSQAVTVVLSQSALDTVSGTVFFSEILTAIFLPDSIVS